jgi:hypothetical protein
MNDKPTQLPLELRPRPTGDVWEPSTTHPATVPVPVSVVIVRIEGPYTALDRKLWLVLLHHAWNELGKLDSQKPYHEISVTELLRLFRRFGRGDIGKRGVVKFSEHASIGRMPNIKALRVLSAARFCKNIIAKPGRFITLLMLRLRNVFWRRAFLRAFGCMSCWRCAANTQ